MQRVQKCTLNDIEFTQYNYVKNSLFAGAQVLIMTLVFGASPGHTLKAFFFFVYL